MAVYMNGKSDTYLHIFIAFVVFAAFLIVTGLKIENATSIIEAMLAGGITFVALQLNVAQRIAQIASKVATDVGASLTILDDAEKRLKQLTDTIGPVTKDLNTTRDELRDGIRTSVDILRRVPRLEQITDGLDVPNALKVAYSITCSFESYAKAWSESAVNIRITDDPSIAHAWSKLMEIYLEEETKNLMLRTDQVPTGEIYTSSKIYTEIVSSCCEKLTELHPNERITLLLVTGMLPDEFFNWPQAEYATDSPYLEFVAHTWEGAEDYFKKMEILKGKALVKRCILVKAEKGVGVGTASLPSLHTFDELQQLADYCILYRPMTYEMLKDLKMTEMFGTIAKSKPSGYDTGKRFVRIDAFRFYPIGTRQEFSNSVMTPSGKLLETFIDTFHTSRDNARFYSLTHRDVTMINVISRSELIPEIAAFRIESPNSKNHSRDWLFAVRGYLVPFTESMRIQFLAGPMLTPLKPILRSFEKESQQLMHIM